MAKLKRTYAAREGSYITDADAQVVGKEFERIEKRDGCLKPPAIVDEARPETAPLHPHFTWDDQKAAELFRQDEARTLIRSVVLLTVEGEETPPSRAFVSVNSSPREETFEGSGYISVVRAMGDDQYREQVLKSALQELSAFRDRYKHLRELAVVIQAIDGVVTG